MLRCTFVLMLIWVCVHGSNALAKPSSEVPDAMLSWSQVPETKPLYDEVTQGYQELLATVQKYATSERPVQLSALGKTQARVMALRRKALHLAQLGEPAGHDLRLRLADLAEATFQCIDVSQETPAGQKMLERINASLPTFNKELRKTQQAMQAALAKDNWEQAEKIQFAFQDKTQPIMTMTGRFSHVQYKPIADLISQVAKYREQRQRAEGDRAFAIARDAVLPDYQAVLTELREAIQQLQSSATATVATREVSGPELLAYLEQQWVSTVRSGLVGRAYEWARCDATQQVESEVLTRIESDLQTFSKAMQNGVIMTLEADASRSGGSEVKMLYDSYLPAIARITSRVRSDDLRRRASEALLKLARKSPQLAEQVALFQASTDELLRWKARVSKQTAKSQSGFATAESLYVSALQKDVQFGGIYQGHKSTEHAQLAVAANRIILRAKKKIDGKSLWSANYVGSGDGGPSTAYRGRLVSRVPNAAEAVATAISAFKRDLLVNNEALLSLPLAEAMVMAERDDWMAVGGKVNTFSLDSLVGLQATLPAKSAGWVPMGMLSSEQIDSGPSKQLVLFAEISPEWLQGKYFCVVLSTP